MMITNDHKYEVVKIIKYKIFIINKQYNIYLTCWKEYGWRRLLVKWVCIRKVSSKVIKFLDHNECGFLW